MNDAMGSVVTLTIIVVFIVLVSAYMAFQVNYTKAFRMKNKIIDVYEKYNGDCGTTSECEKSIKEYADSIGYHPYNLTSCPETANVSGNVVNSMYCIYKFDVATDNDKSVADMEKRHYYRVMTVIDIKIPIIQNIFGLQLMSVTGDTKLFKS